MKSRRKNNLGISLVEVVVSIALIGIISISLLPMFAFSTRANKKNTIKTNALNIAYSQIEWIKGLKYKDIGLNEEKYKPFGIIDKDKYMNKESIININGVEYMVNTNISWEDANSLLDGKIANAVKKVEVTVYKKNKINNKIEKYASLDTLITYEHEGKFYNPGNLHIYVFMKNKENPVEHMRIKLIQDSRIIGETNTDREGRGSFGDLEDGEYIILPEIGDKELMFEPTEVKDNNYYTKKTVNIEKNDREAYFYADKPVFLKVNGICPKDLSIWLQPDENSLDVPENIEQNGYMKIIRPLDSISKTKLWWKWRYEYDISQQGTDNKYFLIDKSSNKIWNGQFEESKDNINMKEVYIAIGMNSEANLKFSNGNENNIITIELEFSAPVKCCGDLELKIDDEKITDSPYYNWSIEKDNKTSDFSKKIIVNIEDKENRLNIKNNSELEIINPECLSDQYGIELAPSLNKSVIKIKGEE